jgi:cytochrome c553
LDSLDDSKLYSTAGSIAAQRVASALELTSCMEDRSCAEGLYFAELGRENPMKALMPLIVIWAAAQSAHAADTEAGKQLATTVWAACHGPSGISVSDTVPNPAGQRADTSRRSCGGIA